MAYDEDLADRVRGLLPNEPFAEKRMFGGLAFLLHGNMSVAVSGDGGLLVRADPRDYDELLAEPGAGPLAMGGRSPMKGWLRVSAAAVAGDEALQVWIDRAVAHARTLPPK